MYHSKSVPTLKPPQELRGLRQKSFKIRKKEKTLWEGGDNDN